MKQIQSEIRGATLSSATLESYRSGWRDFERWCRINGSESVPAQPGVVYSYLVDRYKGLSASALRMRVAAIAHFHQEQGYPTPTTAEEVQRVLEQIRGGVMSELLAEVEEEKLNRIEAMLNETKRKLIPVPSEDLTVIRDRAIILTAIAADLRRSEVVGLAVQNIQASEYWMRIGVQSAWSGGVRYVDVARSDDKSICPVYAVEEWLKTAAIVDGPVFRAINRHGQVRSTGLSDKAVSLIVKRVAEQAGLDPSHYSAEDLRQIPAK